MEKIHQAHIRSAEHVFTAVSKVVECPARTVESVPIMIGYKNKFSWQIQFSDYWRHCRRKWHQAEEDFSSLGSAYKLRLTQPMHVGAVNFRFQQLEK